MRIPECFYQRAVEFVKEKFLLHNYVLYVRVGGSAPEGLEEMGGAVQLDHSYYTADIWLNDEVPTLESAFSIVIHEMLHIRLSSYDQLSLTLEKMLDKPQRKVYKQLFTVADEQATTALQRILSELLWEDFCDYYKFDEAGLPRPSSVSKPKRVRTSAKGSG